MSSRNNIYKADTMHTATTSPALSLAPSQQASSQQAPSQQASSQQASSQQASSQQVRHTFMNRVSLRNRTPKSAKHTDHNDKTLMEQLAQGDRRAAALFVEIYLPYIQKICAKYLGNHPSDIDDATQEIFASVWRNAAQWDSERAKLTTWLYRIAVNRAIDIIRRRRHHAPLENAEHIADNAETPIDLKIQAEQHQIIKHALNTLNPIQQQAIELVYYQELKQADVAERLNISLAALESILRRARSKLHQKLANTEIAKPLTH